MLFCVSSLPGTSYSQIRANRKLNPQSIPPHINTLLVLQNKAKISSKLRSCSHVTEIPISNAMSTQSKSSNPLQFALIFHTIFNFSCS
uniref:Uncharacterized protein n=1 Tax=Solanum tuberosum TaxID=4113 RepID=M0ZPT8_SOLTU